MADGEGVRPAMTAEEWAARETRQGGPDLYHEGATKLLDWFNYDDSDEGSSQERLVVYGESGWRYPIADRHATAALCLHGQPFGFWPELPKTLRIAAEHLRVLTGKPDDWGDLEIAADRIEALLPPAPNPADTRGRSEEGE